MANVITGNPLILDTAADNIYKPGITIHITNMYWVPSAIDQTCQVENGSELVIWEATTTEIGTAGTPITNPQIAFNPPYRCSGLSLGTLTAGGTLYIYLAHKVALGA